jgi:hypothetical protein
MGGATVSTPMPVTPERLAVITVDPSATPVASPWLPLALLIVATAGVTAAHVAVVVRFCVELSENVPVAVNCCVCPVPIVAERGVTAMEVSVGPVPPMVVVTLAELLRFVSLAAVTVAVFVRDPLAGKLTLYMIVILAPFASVLKPHPTIH